MRSSSQFARSPSKKKDGFVLGPIIYPDNTGDAVTTKSSRLNTSFMEKSSPPEMGDVSFRSAKSRKSTKKSKKSSKSSKKSKKRIKCAYRDQDCPIRKEKREAEFLRDTKSAYEKRKRAQLIELAKRAEGDHDRLMDQRATAQKTAREIESSMAMEEDSRDRSMTIMKKKIDGIDWKSGRDLKDLRKEVEEWKKKSSMSGDLANRVSYVEKRLDVLEKAEMERKKTSDMMEKNGIDVGRLNAQLMAFEITQIKNRSGAKHLRKMPKELAETTAKNLYQLCADLHRLTFHLNQKESDFTRLVEEALILAEVIAPLYGPKEEFVDSRENASCTNVSLINHTMPVPAAGSSTASSGGSAHNSPNTQVRSSLRRVGKTSAEVSIPALSTTGAKYSLTNDLVIDAPSLREKSSNYYSDKEFMSLSKEGHANCEPGSSKDSVDSHIPPSVVPVAVPPQSTTAVPPPTEPSPASVSISLDSSERDLVKEKKKSRSFLEEERKH